MERRSLRTGTLLVLALALMAFTAMSTNVPMLRLQSQLVIFSGLALLYCFLFHPMALVFRNSRWAKMMDWGLAGTSLLVTLYLVFQFESPSPRVHQGMALLGLLLLLEGSRRATGMALPFLVFLFGFYGFFGSLLPGFLLPHRGFSEERLLAQCFLPGQGIFGMALEVTFHEAFLLVAFGVLLAQLGGPRFVLQELERRFRGQTGAAEKVAVLSSALLGSVSATPALNTSLFGPFTLPRMRREGLENFAAAGVAAAASLGSVLVPPVLGVGAFLMFTLLSPAVSLRQILLASLIPSLLYYFSLFLSVSWRARQEEAIREARREETVELMLMPEIPEEPAASRWQGVLLLIGVLLLTVPLFAGWPVARAALAAIFATLLLACLRPETRPGLGSLAQLCRRSAEAALPLIFAAAGVGMVLGVANLTGLGAALQSTFLDLMQYGLTPALLLMAALSLLVGLALPSAVVYLLLALLLGPALSALGPLPLAVHFFLLYFGLMATITPPLANAAAAAADMAGASLQKTSLRACRLSLVGFALPFLFIFRPQLLMLAPGGGPATWSEVLLACLVAILGTLPLAGADAGFFGRPIGPLWRVLLLLIAAIIFYPAAGPPAAVPFTWINVAGVVLLFAVAAYLRPGSDVLFSSRGHHNARN